MNRDFIMAVDPGVTTGVCFGFLRWRPTDLPSEAFARSAEQLVTDQTQESDEVWAGRNLAILWIQYIKGRPQDRVHLVVEDFILRGTLKSTAKTALSPVRVTAAMEAILHERGAHPGPRLRRQGASDAKGYATDARLREWGLWTPGKEHGRDAARHWATFAARLLGA